LAEEVVLNSLRCSLVARDEGFDPLGTAGSYRGFLLVDWPLPWPSDLSEAPGLAPVVAALAGTGIRLQGVVPGSSDTRRVALYVRASTGADGTGVDGADGAGFTGYRRLVRRTGADPSPDDVVAVALGLVASADALAATPEPPSWADTLVGDLLVCTHGRRDACCGSSGTALVMGLLTDDEIVKAGYQVGRTSHTGGHRFAPTAIVLPEGTMWAFLDLDLTSRVVRREGPVADALEHYRGSTAMGSPAQQALERVAFGEVGWEWLDWSRTGETLPEGRVRVTGIAPDGTRRTWEATATSRTVPVPDCGKPLTEARKTSDEPTLTTVIEV
jgi:hypothetical protein